MLLSIALIFLVGILLSSIFEKLKLPGLLGMIIAGVVIGPFALNLIDSSVLGMSSELRRIALIVILIRAGLNINVEELIKVGRPALLMSFLPATIEMLAVTLLAPILFSISYLEAAIMGAVVAAVSPAVVVPRMINLIDSGHGGNKSIPQMIMAGASIDDIYVIIVFTSLMSMYGGLGFNPVSLLGVPVAIVTGLIIGVLVGLALVKLFEKTNLSLPIKVLIILSVAFALVSVESVVNYYIPISALLSVMALGATLLKTSQEASYEFMIKFRDIWAGAEIILFVLLGAAVDINYLLKAGPIAIILILLALVFRIIGVNLALIGTNLNNKEKLFCSLAYLPKATVQAAIGAIPLASGVQAGNIILTVAALTIVITAPLGAVGVDVSFNKLLAQPEMKSEI